jgi:cobalt-zinc-cadmium efflux system outer membrane protein
VVLLLFRNVLAGALCLLASAAALAAETTEPSPGADLPPLTLRAAITKALAGNPSLAPFDWQLKAQAARIEAAALRPAPQLSAEVENVLGSGRTRGLAGAETTLALSQVIELGGQPARRVDAARAGVTMIDSERQIAQLEVLAEVSRRYIHVASDQAQLQLTRLATQLAEKTLTEVRRRVTAAKSPKVEQHRAEIVLIRARVEEEHAEHELLTSRQQLAAQWGAGEARFGKVQAELFALPRVEDFAAASARLAASPDLLRFEREAVQRDAELALAQARGRSDPSVSAGVRQFQESGDAAFVAGFSLPLFSARRAQPAIAEARARRAAIDADAAISRLKAETRLFELVQELKHSITEAETLRDQVLPQMEAALKETEYAWQRGRYSYLEWVDAQRERVSVQRSLIEAAANAHLFRVEIERLTGMALPDPSNITAVIE